MSQAKVVFLDRDTIPSHIEVPKPDFPHHWVEYAVTTAEQVVERAQDADVIIVNKVKLTADILAQLPELCLVAVAATGYDNIDVAYCEEHGIAVTNIRGYATQSVPEYVLAMIFALKRNLLAYKQDIADGEWQRQNKFCFFTHAIGDVAGSTLGIIGAGELGKATASLAQAVGMQVLFAEVKGAPQCREGFVPFDEVLAQSDVVTLHCPLNRQTRNLIAAPELAQMKSTALLINAGRGGLVDEQALVDALKHQQIAGAGVDVFTSEPADESNPLIANMALPNLLLTPHVAWGSDSALTRFCRILIDNINAFMDGEQLNRVV
ncbi:D-2-hydroxyacid dehydrogenase [Vibrio sp. SM6]|uniref:D-2-hydroxyacid dehydrogenase n=1 Tax=Vibrio agarilyticus TaxID=2726741 RepID=A0A7X8TRS6_9VIBR|nr:D-2-hydroxyacid dehydrogenase [Vibrio agarilyticus]NLS13579.1 D-2-hydroxyacid dehydrogenase [Vibrio agarilyticus]